MDDERAIVDLNVTFSSVLTARAFAVKEGRNLIHADCLIYDDDDEDRGNTKAKAVLFSN